MADSVNNWGKYETLVLEDLRRLRVGHEQLSQEIRHGLNRLNMEIATLKGNELKALNVEIATLKGKAAVWGFLAGSFAAGAISLMLGLVLRVV